MNDAISKLQRYDLIGCDSDIHIGPESCGDYVKYAEVQAALQHAGQGEAVAWLHIHPNGKGVSFSPPDKHGPIKGIPLYTHPQPAVPDAPEVVFDMLKAAQCCCLLGLNDTADKYIQNAIDLLSAGKEKTE